MILQCSHNCYVWLPVYYQKTLTITLQNMWNMKEKIWAQGKRARKVIAPHGDWNNFERPFWVDKFPEGKKFTNILTHLQITSMKWIQSECDGCNAFLFKHHHYEWIQKELFFHLSKHLNWHFWSLHCQSFIWNGKITR